MPLPDLSIEMPIGGTMKVACKSTIDTEILNYDMPIIESVCREITRKIVDEIQKYMTFEQTDEKDRMQTTIKGTLDIVPKGMWEDGKLVVGEFMATRQPRCSICKADAFEINGVWLMTPYCPMCGANLQEGRSWE